MFPSAKECPGYNAAQVMGSETSVQLALLRAFEGAFREGLLLDQSLGAILDAALSFFDASAVALLPTSDGPATSRSTSRLQAAAEDRLRVHLRQVLKELRPVQIVDSGLGYYGIPVKINDTVHAAFGVALPPPEGEAGPTESLRLFARTISHVLERERTLATLLKRRDEAMALFDLAAGVFHSLNAEEVIQLTVASLSRELGFDRVKAYRYDPETGDIEELLSQGETHPDVIRRSIDSEELLVRCLTAQGPVFDDAEASGGIQRERRQMALPIQAGSTVFGFLVMSRRGSFVLTVQEMRLANELAKITAGALDRSRLVDAERMYREQLELAKELRSTLAGLTEVGTVLERAAKKLGRHFDLDVCTLRLLPHGDQPGAAASYVRQGLPAIPQGEEVPEALMVQLAPDGSHILIPDIANDRMAPSFLPAPSVLRDLPKPISLLAVPITYQGNHAGVIAAVKGGTPRGFDQVTLRSFKTVSSEFSLAVGSARLLERERKSVRFLDRLQEIGRPLFSTFDAQRIKQILCREALSLVSASSSHFWDTDSQPRTLRASACFGERRGDPPHSISLDRAGHPLVRAFVERKTIVGEEAGTADMASNASARWAVVPVTFQDELIGLFSAERPGSAEPWDSFVGVRLALLAEKGAIALHNARLMALIEQQTEHDSQTGLYNRKAVHRRLESEIRRGERNGQSLAIVHIRLHGLGLALQKLASGFSNKLMSSVSARLTGATRALNLVGRDRAEYFWILIFDANKSQAQRAIQNIQQNFEASMEAEPVQDVRVPLKLTAGISCYPADGFDADDLMRAAEKALKEASGLGPGTVVFYDEMPGVRSAAPAPLPSPPT
jgi:diguanylate cyclase (GGDEF)-like protein